MTAAGHTCGWACISLLIPLRHQIRASLCQTTMRIGAPIPLSATFRAAVARDATHVWCGFPNMLTVCIGALPFVLHIAAQCNWDEEGLSSCHSAIRRSLAAMDLQLQNEPSPLLSQWGHTKLPPNLVRSSTRASHWCTPPHFGQPWHCSQTRLWLTCL